MARGGSHCQISNSDAVRIRDLPPRIRHRSNFMRRLAVTLAAVFAIATPLHAQSRDEVARWQKSAGQVTIVRDDWGIAHIHGKTDADAVFALMYAQAEDDFNRVETNYINSMGRLAEAE